MFKKKPTEQRFEFINQEVKLSKKPNSLVVCTVPIPKHLNLWDSEDGDVTLVDPTTFRRWKKYSIIHEPLIEVGISYEKKCSSFNEMKEYLDRSLKKYSEWEDPFYYRPADIDINYGIRTSCERNEIISAKSLSIRSSSSDDLVSYYYPSDFLGPDSDLNTVSINFYSYTLIRGSMFRFSLGISKEILSKKHLNLRRDKHEVRTSEGWLRSYVFLFRQKNGVYVYP